MVMHSGIDSRTCSRALPVDFKDDVVTGIQVLSDLLTAGAVIVIEHLGILEQLSGISQLREFVLVDKQIVDTVRLVTSLGSRSYTR